MRLLLIFLNIIYAIQLISGECNEYSFKKLERYIPNYKIIRYGDNVIDGNDGYLKFATKRIGSVYSVRTVDSSYLPYKALPVKANHLCNGSNHTIFVNVKNLLVSPVFEFILDRPANTYLQVAMSIPDNDYLEIPNDEICFSRILVYNNALVSIKCLSKFKYKPQTLNHLLGTNIELDDVPIAVCKNNRCLQKSNDGVEVYYAALVNTNDYDRILYEPVITACPIRYATLHWECKKGHVTIDGTISSEVCSANNEQMVYIKSLSIFRLTVDIHTIDDIKNVALRVDRNYVCLRDRLPDIVYLRDIILTPLVSMYYTI